MVRPKCPNAVSANVYYYYENHPLNDPLWSGSIVSAHPSLIADIIQLNGEQATCDLHYITITSPLLHWTERYRGGVEQEAGFYEQRFSVYGPIGGLKIETVGNLDGYYGFYQNISLYCRGPFGYSGCQPPDYYSIGIQQGGAGNHYLFDTDNIRVEGIQNWNDPITPPYRFTVIDEDGLIYDRTESAKPHITYIECVGNCPTGWSRIGGCCIDCEDLTSKLTDIREALRRV